MRNSYENENVFATCIATLQNLFFKLFYIQFDCDFAARTTITGLFVNFINVGNKLEYDEKIIRLNHTAALSN